MASDEASAPESVAIDHRHLRSALEFAVTIAAETAKRKPPMASPKELKPFFGVDRIPNPALGRIRRAVEADERFRTRIAAGAIPELVDDIGRLWLQRPDGWQEEIAAAIVAAEEAEEARDAQRALKRSERRRLAAEQATARATADVVRLEAAVEEVRRDRDEIRLRLAEAEDVAERLRTELIEARTEARHAGDRERAAVGRLDEARRQLAAYAAREGEVERSRPASGSGAAGVDASSTSDDAVGDAAIMAAAGAPGGAAGSAAADSGPADSVAEDRAAAERQRLEALRADVERAATVVERAAAELRRTLAGSGDQGAVDAVAVAGRSDARSDDPSEGPSSGPAEGRSDGPSGAPPAGRGRRGGRVPISLPGGVRSSSPAAAEFLLRSGTPVLVDGYNVAMLAWPTRDLCAQRETLIDAVENLARRFNATTTIVFDGSAVVGAHAPRRRLTRVVYSPEGVTADDVIRGEVARLDPAPVVVVTNDAEIRRDVRAAGANVVSSTTLVELLRP